MIIDINVDDVTFKQVVAGVKKNLLLPISERHTLRTVTSGSMLRLRNLREMCVKQVKSVELIKARDCLNISICGLN